MNADGRVTFTLDGQQVETDKGRLLIDVAEELGIYIPRFCYHPGMESVAVCRMCLVKVEGQKKLLPACATPINEGMAVSTVDPEAVDAQQSMLEFLLINHPLDCPICDRGGECPLQDQTYRHGPGSSRYMESKRTFAKPLEISDLVVLDRERCVLCWRCVRFADEVAGDRFIQLVERGPGTQILTFKDEPFDSYFSGNTIQICPVGALTAKPYRFVSRPWDLQSAPSVCAYCAVGCPISNEVRANKVVRCQALPNQRVNEFWNCDKGRFGYHYVDSADRLTTPLVRRGERLEATSWGEALTLAADRLEDARKVGVIASGHLTTEDAYAISKLAKKVIKTPHVDSRLQDAGAPYELTLEVGGVAGSTATINDLDTASAIVWVGPDPKETLPVLYLRLRRAALEGGIPLFVVSPRRITLDDMATEVVRCVPGGEADALSALPRAHLGDGLVACWGPTSPGRDEADAFRAVTELTRDGGGRLLVCPPHAGSQGMIDMGVHPRLDAGYRPAPQEGMGTRAILEAAANGDLDGLLVFGADLTSDFPDADLARRALEAGLFTLVVELFATDTARRADVVLPSAAYAEREGTFVNLERRIQRLERAVSAPGTAVEPWSACARMAAAMGQEWGWKSIPDVWTDIKKTVPTFGAVDLTELAQRVPPPTIAYESPFESHKSERAVAGPGAGYPKGFRSGAPFSTGQNWPLSWELREFEAHQRPGYVPPLPEERPAMAPPAPTEDSTQLFRTAVERPRSETTGSIGGAEREFALLTGRMIYDEGEMIRRTSALRGLQQEPFVEINREDAKELGISDGDEVVLSSAGFEASVPARVADIAKGVVFVPYDQRGLKANELIRGINPTVKVKSTRS